MVDCLILHVQVKDQTKGGDEMTLEKKYKPLLLVNVIVLAAFTFYYVANQNYEFLVYIAVVVFFAGLIFFTRNKVNYPVPVLWGLSVWALMHMSGGSIYLGETRLYELILIPLVGEPYHILKYDQAVHAYGFAVTTFLAYHVLKPHLGDGVRGKMSLAIILTMAGLGAGALNEILEFITVIITPNTGVGGYMNTSLDLVANLIGAAMAAAWIYVRGDGG